MNIERCPGVYDPDDDSYLLANIKEIRGKVLEIGCGSGIVGLSYALRGSKVLMTDVSKVAASCAKKNAKKNSIAAEVIISDLFSAIRGKFDFCLFNPPYLPSGDADDVSWTGGINGNEITLNFLKSFKDHCNVAFLIESSLSRIDRTIFPKLNFKVVESLTYDFEVINVTRVE
ncbi:MAG: methyltransferase [Thermoplasmatales archaeon]